MTEQKSLPSNKDINRSDLDVTPIHGDIEFPDEWTVFIKPEKNQKDTSHPREADHDLLNETSRLRLKKAADGEDPVLSPEVLQKIPTTMTVNGEAVTPHSIKTLNYQADLRPLLTDPPYSKLMYQPSDSRACGRVAYIFIPMKSIKAQKVTLGFGADLWLEIWINGEKLYDGRKEEMPFPPSIRDRVFEADFNKGHNLLAARFVSGKGSSTLAIGGPQELRSGNFKSILNDPLLANDEQWTSPSLRVKGSPSEIIDIDNRLELFIDDFLIDSLSGGASRQLHSPVPREIIFNMDKPWEGNCNGCFLPVSIFKESGRVLMYYKGANMISDKNPCEYDYRTRDRSRPEATCLAVSRDGINFERVDAGKIDYRGSKSNNMVWQGRQYFTPFLDTSRGVPKKERYKAITGHDDGGLAAYGSPDGIDWTLLKKEPIITKGAFDSQNLAFWDSVGKCYREYHRGSEPSGPRRGVRGIMTSRSDDFRNWSDPVSIDYSDELPLHMYTNCIRPYERAPHLLIGTPARYVGQRKKIPNHMDSGVCDALLISSRDGYSFNRWLEAFIRPNAEPENWADRNCYPAWGMVQTSQEELSVYWCEHNGYPTLRLRRGTIRTDGFASVRTGIEVGECLTRPLVFSGDNLIVNYSTSAAGTIRFELCRPDGETIEGYALEDSEVLYGNEIGQKVAWNGKKDLTGLRGQPVRLRFRMQDSNIYSIKFD